MRIILALVIFCLASAYAATASAEEQVLSFVADIDVRSDGVLDITETIKVRAEGDEIRRGIYRDIPLRALDEWGLWSRNGLTIRNILHDGQPSPYKTEWAGRFYRIYIGEADTFIPTGEHTYTIAYSTTHQLRHFDSYDELYWNVTGNFWTFPILRATATVELPEGAVAGQIAGYTGGFGESGSDYKASGEGTSRLEFHATRPLATGEGMTIAVAFPKGIVPPKGASGLLLNIFANIGAIVFAIGWIGVPAYFLIVWWRIGRDPPGETVIPLYHPPENLSPAAMSYVHFKSFRQIGRGTDLAFIAALLSLGVKKLLMIKEDDKGKIRFKRGEGDRGKLAYGEKALFDGLFSGRSEIPLDKRYGKTLINARSAMHASITREYGGKFFKKNIGWFLPGAIVAAVTLILGLVLQAPPDEGISTVVVPLIASLIGWTLLIMGWNRFTTPTPTLMGRITGVLFIAAGLGLVLLGLNAALFLTDLPAYRIAGMMVFLGGALIVAMFFLIAAPTLEGAKVLSRIEGFLLYLTTAETNRLNLRDAPEMTEELYERYLPYAAGLGVEEPWSEAYSAHLSRTAPDVEHEYRPQWYDSRRWQQGSLAQATATSMAAVSAAMASSMPQPKSSSGSSGGGFSGGGGGGGGGGGW